MHTMDFDVVVYQYFNQLYLQAFKDKHLLLTFQSSTFTPPHTHTHTHTFTQCTLQKAFWASTEPLAANPAVGALAPCHRDLLFVDNVIDSGPHVWCCVFGIDCFVLGACSDRISVLRSQHTKRTEET